VRAATRCRHCPAARGLTQAVGQRIHAIIISFERGLGGEKLSAVDEASIVTAAKLALRQEALREVIARTESVDEGKLLHIFS
jgi:hypothetical protein